MGYDPFANVHPDTMEELAKHAPTQGGGSGAKIPALGPALINGEFQEPPFTSADPRGMSWTYPSLVEVYALDKLPTYQYDENEEGRIISPRKEGAKWTEFIRPPRHRFSVGLQFTGEENPNKGRKFVVEAGSEEFNDLTYDIAASADDTVPEWFIGFSDRAMDDVKAILLPLCEGNYIQDADGRLDFPAMWQEIMQPGLQFYAVVKFTKFKDKENKGQFHWKLRLIGAQQA